eukprot:gnl/TRDRNA2_/TRDRNA2_32184_c0_seq1.p2 gnl/TRDRNA2_/TRDRNA2_32184_c0~~gnl/TRDRNA2_/TRDRNA2_32184_c0_seq1.p2  ORF type:complete len:112 (+),score=8.53 gnl/TRDRNA2_/TRDRNA2_32184_c0_seq1:391-726(+)
MATIVTRGRLLEAGRSNQEQAEKRPSEAVATDLMNSFELAAPDTIVMLDHVFTNMLESVGPSRAWAEALQRGHFIQCGFHSCCERHGIAIGRLPQQGLESWLPGRENLPIS